MILQLLKLEIVGERKTLRQFGVIGQRLFEARVSDILLGCSGWRRRFADDDSIDFV